MAATPPTDLMPDWKLTREDLARFIQQLLRNTTRYTGPERRKEPRRMLVVQVSARPLDDRLQPAGEAFIALSRDISSNGAALLHTAAVTSPYLALAITDAVQGTSVRAALEVVRCQPKGRFYEIAGKFVYKIYEQQAQATGEVTE